ncbi:DUF4352 domain-containing protein [Mesobacillus subterraneus]|uniref:DUF4352 domain-containing protein n=1 Tax=Mesobacillus subterraneus TaxID=285983 RepID=UPI00203AAF92|nr:DUF4352 domain-containing protein [Mesobacillus subterraneus]MCM3574021.1 DUF4352 domain-containing protein [Mesobacillus subterraneus]
MRNFIVWIVLMSFLVGCSLEGNSNSPEQIEKEESVQKEQNEDTPPPRKSMNDYVPNPQVTDDRTLLSVGETVRDEKGYAKLISYKKMDQRIETGPIEMVVKEAKIIEYHPDYSLIDFFHSYTDEERFTFMKIFVEIENKSEEVLNFAPVAIIESDTGEKKTWEDDIYLEELNGVIRPGEKKAGNIGVIVENPDIKSTQITTSKVLSKSEDDISKEQTITIQF